MPCQVGSGSAHWVQRQAPDWRAQTQLTGHTRRERSNRAPKISGVVTRPVGHSGKNLSDFGRFCFWRLNGSLFNLRLHFSNHANYLANNIVIAHLSRPHRELCVLRFSGSRGCVHCLASQSSSGCNQELFSLTHVA